MELIDESEVIENDVIGYRIKKAKKMFNDLDREDFVTVTIHKPPEPDILADILRGLKKEFAVKNMNNGCTEFVLAELGYRTCYKYLARSGFIYINWRYFINVPSMCIQRFKWKIGDM